MKSGLVWPMAWRKRCLRSTLFRGIVGACAKVGVNPFHGCTKKSERMKDGLRAWKGTNVWQD